MSVNPNSERQVVVTGLGVISPIGIGVDEFWKNLEAGVTGIREMSQAACSPVPRRFGAEVPGFDPSKYTKTREQKKAIRVMCREVQMGFAAAVLGLADASLVEGSVEPDRLGVEFGANLMFSPPEELMEGAFACCTDGEQNFHRELWGDKGLSKMFPLWLLKYLPNMPACHIGIAADARGPNNSITLDEASFNLVIGEAHRVIARGHADVMITGSTGSRVNGTKAIHAVLWDELASCGDSAADACRPFDLHRCGQVVGEGAGSVILEELEHARARGATILGQVLGAGSSCVARPDGSVDQRRAMAHAMRSAIADAGLAPDQIGHINAHGLASRESDLQEALAIHDVFGDLATRVPVTALKSYLGNSAAGCGSLEFLGSLVALRHGVVPPTLNYRNADPQMRLCVVAKEPRPVDNKTFLKINVTRAGQASAIVARAF
jgi:3-oxoacyl-[acyl-carrier-protein] synthase II